MSKHIASWELRSNSGDALAKWDVLEVSPAGVMLCDFQLTCSYSGQGAESRPVLVEAKQLSLGQRELEHIERLLRTWVDQPLPELSKGPLEARFSAGAVFDNLVTLTFARRADVIYGHNQVASFTLAVGKLRGEFVFVTDQSCIRLLCDGIRAALETLGSRS
jgi:hypothetical protein